jgi:hypothetical protein
MTDQPSDNSEFHNAIYEGSNREHVGRRLDLVGASTAFQADDEGSIPFTRSNDFSHLAAPLFAGDTSVDCCGDTFTPDLFPARIFRRPLRRASSVLRIASMLVGE